jgi:hypothetical protein
LHQGYPEGTPPSPMPWDLNEAYFTKVLFPRDSGNGVH